MKKSLLLMVVLITFVVGHLAIIHNDGPQNPIAILPLGQPRPDIPVAEFLITNQSNNELEISFDTQFKADGKWQFPLRGCIVILFHLQPHATHIVTVEFPPTGESRRLVVEYRRAETRVSRLVKGVRSFFGHVVWLPEPTRVFEPETSKEKAQLGALR